MESSTENGLTIIYDDEASLLTFEWDENTHPEYNCLKGLTSEKLFEMMLKDLEQTRANDQPEQGEEGCDSSSLQRG
jgi:hypothetical protein